MISTAAALALAILAVQNPVHPKDTSPHGEHTVQVNGVKLHYLDWGGDGEPLLLLTGYGATAHTFDDLAPRLTKRFRVLAFTRRGLEPSERPPSGYDLATLTADVGAFLDALGLRRVHLAGHSFGGIEMTQLATLHPDRVISLVYFDAAVDPAAAQAVMKESPVPAPQAPPGSPFAQVNEWLVAHSPDYSKLKCPVLAFYAVQDRAPTTPKNASEDLRRRNDEFWRAKWTPMVRETAAKLRREALNSQIVIFENTGHYLFRERKDEVLREMEKFYASIQGSKR